MQIGWSLSAISDTFPRSWDYVCCVFIMIVVTDLAYINLVLLLVKLMCLFVFRYILFLFVCFVAFA